MSLWDKIFLKEVSSIMYGYTAKASLEIDGPKYLRITDIQNQTVKWEDVPNCQIDKDFEKYSLKKGDIVFARTGATTGKSFLISSSPDAVFASYLIRVQINTNRLLPEFLYKYFQTQEYWDLIEKGTTGSAQGGFNATKLGELGIPIPPLPEQKRIVEILDEAFEAIDQAKANIEKNIQNAEELFQSKLNEIFSQKGEGWEEKTILELCDHKSQIVGGPFGSNLKVIDYKESGVPILRLQNIGKGYFIDKNIKFISEEKASELDYHSFVSGDIVLAKLGIPIGKTCVVPEKFEYGIVTADVVRIRPNKEHIVYSFLKHFLNSQNAVQQLTDDITGATRPRVNIAEVRNLKLSVPSKEEQVSLNTIIDDLERSINGVISNFEKKKLKLNELKKSILQKAFNGELTANEELVV